MPRIRTFSKWLIISSVIALIIYSTLNWKNVNFTVMCAVLAILIIAAFFAGFEKHKPDAKNIMPIAVMCTVATVGRAIFIFIPQIQPATTIVIIMGVCFGKQTGFITGALTALISNMLLGQGPWTV
jgi:energy-coupling factor transport system substrate-specific component